MQILVIGPGCSKCKTLAQFTEQAVKELGVTAEISKVTGKVPSIPEIKTILQQAAA